MATKIVVSKEQLDAIADAVSTVTKIEDTRTLEELREAILTLRSEADVEEMLDNYVAKSEIGAASGVAPLDATRKIDEQYLPDISSPGGYFGRSSTSSATKVVTCEGFKLEPGVIIGVLFTAANTSVQLALNVNGTGAKNVKVGGSSVDSSIGNTLQWAGNTVVYFMYDGQYYNYISSQTSGNYDPSRGGAVWKGSCSTAASTPTKSVTCAYYVPYNQSIISVSFSKGSTATSMNLDINGSGPVPVSFTGWGSDWMQIDAGETLYFRCDGASYTYIGREKYKSSHISRILGYTPAKVQIVRW